MSNKKTLLGLLASVLVLAGSCYAITDGRPPCRSNDTVYDADGTCHPGGELVVITHVVDGDTLELDDGRIVRLLGVEAPGAETCAGPGATEFTRSLVEGKTVELHREPRVDLDRHGHILGYIQYGGRSYSDDLGHDLVVHGWALRSDDDARYLDAAGYPTYRDDGNSTYMRAIESAAGIAQYLPSGIFQEPCGAPRVYGDDDGDGTADFDSYGGAPNVNLPDGALTGGFCARKRWC